MDIKSDNFLVALGLHQSEPNTIPGSNQPANCKLIDFNTSVIFNKYPTVSSIGAAEGIRAPEISGGNKGNVCQNIFFLI